MKQELDSFNVPMKTALILASVLGMAGSAQAFQIDSGNPDITMRFDNTVRYTGGWRAKDADMATALKLGNAQGESRFGKGDMVVNRLDWLGEFDFAYQKKTGFRLSAAGWYDQAQSECAVKDKTGFVPVNSYFSSGSYCQSNHWKRYVQGPSGEFLDAFAYTGFSLGETNNTVRLGQHTVYWGESLFETDNNINFNNGPMDLMKAASNPGIEAKEVFLPWNQLSFSSQLNDQLSLNFMYNLQWKPSRSPEAGTWFQFTDFYFTDANNTPAGPRLADVNGRDGSWGVNMRWSPSWLDGGVTGLYYRKFDATGPTIKMGDLKGVLPAGMLQYYAKDVEMLGWSINKSLGAMSVGGEVSYRKNSTLSNPNGLVAGSLETAKGNTWHALINTLQLLTPTPLYDTGTLMAELSYQGLDKVTQNGNLYKGTSGSAGAYSAACQGLSESKAIINGCGTDSWWGLSLGFTPQWLSVFPGVNLSLPISYARGLKGNMATGGGLAQDRSRYSVGVEAEWITLASPIKVRFQYADQSQGAPGSQGLQMYNDRGWWTLNAKMSF